MTGKFYTLVLGFLLSTALTAQQPTPAANDQQQFDTLLLPKRLTTADVDTPLYSGKERIQIISGSRFPISAADLPFSSYVITKEEIRLMGYETLVDALKMAPGIRVSQPGSAVEGETFLMRGFLGNAYTKILINDVPVKPAFVGGMPIGAQLPIKEAERIEVIYGAGASLYGSDASAGIINIITRQSERPVFMQAELSVGQGLYSSVNVMFGGRLGRDKHIFRYFAYASNVLLERRNTFYDTDFNYNPKTYLQDTSDISYTFLDNYGDAPPDKPVLTNTPHMSRKFGITLNYRSLSFSVESMYRRDHSSIGLNPLAVSYRNPLTYTGEGIWRFNLNLFGNKSKHNSKTDFTYLRYRLDNRSSILWVRPQLAGELFRSAVAVSNMQDTLGSPPAEIFKVHYDTYLNGLRYAYGDSDEGRFEHVRTIRLLKLMSVTAGLNLRFTVGNPFTGLLSRPGQVNRDFFSNDDLANDEDAFSIQPQFRFAGESNLFGQVFYTGKRFTLVGGVNHASFAEQSDSVDSLEVSFTQLSPRLAGLLRITENINLRSAWGRAFRLPGEFYKSVTYNVNSIYLSPLTRPFRQLNPETTTTWESGIRWKTGERAAIDLTFFTNETSNLASFQAWGDGFNADSTEYVNSLGFRNAEGSKIKYTGGQVHFFIDLYVNDARAVQGHYNISWIKGTLKTPEISETVYFLPVYSGTQHQLRLIINLLKKGKLAFDYVHVKATGRTTTANSVKQNFGTVDLVARYAFTDRFDAYLKFINLTGKEYPGIPASRTPDDLHYNPQTGFTFRLGMNYYLE